jgi:hypothetical protein
MTACAKLKAVDHDNDPKSKRIQTELVCIKHTKIKVKAEIT